MAAKHAFVFLTVLALATTACSNANPTPKPTGFQRVMFVCGYDTCRDSGEYGKLIYKTGINAWNNPEPDRGGKNRQLDHRQRVIVVEERRVFPGPGGLWYKLQEGGWISDLWLTEAKCTPANLSEYSFKNCWEGEY